MKNLYSEKNLGSGGFVGRTHSIEEYFSDCSRAISVFCEDLPSLEKSRSAWKATLRKLPKKEAFDSLEAFILGRFQDGNDEIDEEIVGACLGVFPGVWKGVAWPVLRAAGITGAAWGTLRPEEMFSVIWEGITSGVEAWVRVQEKNGNAPYLYSFLKRHISNALNKRVSATLGSSRARKEHIELLCTAEDLKERMGHPTIDEAVLEATAKKMGIRLETARRRYWGTTRVEATPQIAMDKEFIDQTSPLLSHESTRSSTSNEIVIELRKAVKGKSPEMVMLFDAYYDALVDNSNEEGCYIHVARQLRADADKKSPNTLTAWGKYQVNQRLIPLLRRLSNPSLLVGVRS